MILLSFAHPNVVSNLYDILQNTNQLILKNVLTESLTSFVWTKNPHFSFQKYFLLCSTAQRKPGLDWHEGELMKFYFFLFYFYFYHFK